MAVTVVSAALLATFGTLLGLSEGAAGKAETELLLVHAVFRHGERTPDACYPSDPYSVQDFYPFGFGQLTQEGRRRMYRLGKFIRERYDGFLGPTYTASKIKVLTSDWDHTKNSANLAMAGMWPADKAQVWGDDCLGQNWVPVAHHTIPRLADHMLDSIHSACPARDAQRLEIIKSKRVQDSLHTIFDNGGLRDYINQHAGKNYSTPGEYTSLYQCLKCEESMGLKLPEWTKPVYPEALRRATKLFMEQFVTGTTMRRTCFGSLLNAFFDTAKGFRRGTNLCGLRFFAYSAHDFTLYGIMKLLRLRDPITTEIPPFGACLFVELHKCLRTGELGFKFFYRYSEDAEIKQLAPYGCPDFCPKSLLRIMVEDDIPESVLKECGGGPTICLRTVL